MTGLLSSCERDRRSPLDTGTSEPLTRRSVVAGPLVAALTLVAALIATQMANVPFRDPDHVAAKYLVLVGLGVVLMVWLDVAVRAGHRSGTRRPSREMMRAVLRERWTRRHAAAAGAALISFYISYLAYRNIKSMVPLLRPGYLFDRELADVDRFLFAGHDPHELLHSLLGAGVQTHVLSVLYLFYVVFVPISLALALVFSRNLRGGLLFATALSLNWPLGAASYLILPALGPVYLVPAEFAHLPSSGVSDLQALLLEQRVEFLSDPGVAGTAQSIAAFASLHVSMIFTAALAAHLLGVRRGARIALWALLGASTVATIYEGWHYVVDDIAGVAIGLAALAIARVLTGVNPTAERRLSPAD